MNLLLIQPPALKPSEPPLGLAILLGHLRRQGVVADAIDANLDACLYLLDDQRLASVLGPTPTTALHRARRHAPRALAALRGTTATGTPDRYESAVRDLNRLLGCWGEEGELLTLGDYRHGNLSPFKPDDLQRLAHGEATTLFASYFRDQLLPRVAALAPRCIALSINYLHQALPAFELAGLLRRQFPHVQLVAGGGLITSWQGVLQDRPPFPFDQLIFGPGEAPLAALAGSPGASDELNFDPDFSFAHLNDYLSPAPVLPLSASRGCYWQRCLFCPEAATPVHPYAAVPRAGLPGLLRSLAENYGVKHLHLTDNAIPMNALRALSSAKEQLSGLHWYGFVRFEAALLDRSFVQDLADSGCSLLQLGLESGSQAVLDRLGKGIDLNTAARILENLHAAGIATYVYIMLGTPGETEADAVLTRDFLQQHAPHIDYLNLAIMNLPRASELLDAPARHGIVGAELCAADSPLSLYRRFQPSGAWNRASARRFLDRELLGTPAIRAIVKRTPPLFTSSHAFFFPPPTRI